MNELERLTMQALHSEHCAHPTFRSSIRLVGDDGDILELSSLYDELIKTTYIPEKHPWVLSAFSGHAGVVSYHEDASVLSFKMETHNHPSAIDPFEGATTGIGGVLRDILAEHTTPIIAFDALGLPSQAITNPRALESERAQELMKGIVSGIGAYGNRFGIPTAFGALRFHSRFLENPLVFAGAIGAAPTNYKPPRKPQARDLLVLVGKESSSDGFGGAAFSSGPLDPRINTSHCVQVGDPMSGRLLSDLMARLRREKLYLDCADLGAGGIATAVCELIEEHGAQLELSPEHEASTYPEADFQEWWLGETQERMLLVIAPQDLSKVQSYAHDVGLRSLKLGFLSEDEHLVLKAGPRVRLKLSLNDRRWCAKETLNATAPSFHLHDVLSMPSIEKNDTYPRYEVSERFDQRITNCVSSGSHNRYREAQAAIRFKAYGNEYCTTTTMTVIRNEQDPFDYAYAAVVKTLKDLQRVGGDISRAALMDNFSWGRVDTPQRLGRLVRGVQGCCHAASVAGLPFISGKDSLNNSTRLSNGNVVDIPGVVVVSGLCPRKN